MTDQDWGAADLDAEAFAQAAERAEALGVSIEDYLTDLLLRAVAPDPAPEEAARDAPYDWRPTPEAPLERPRIAVQHGVGGNLDAVLQALDSSVAGLAARVSETDRVASCAAGDVERTRLEVTGTVASLGKRLTDAEHGLGLLSDAQEAVRSKVDRRFETLGARFDRAETAFRETQSGLGSLNHAYDALKRAVAEDFVDLGRDVGGKLEAGLRDVRAAAEAAAEQTERSARRFSNEMRELRDALDLRLNESAAESRARMHAAFADTAERVNAISERVTSHERQTAGVLDQIRAQVFDVEDGAHSELEAVTAMLRQADADIVAEIQRRESETRAAIEEAQSAALAEVTALKAQHAQAVARLKTLDAADASLAGELSTLRETIDRRLAQAETNATERLAKLQSGVSHRMDALAAGLEGAEERARESEQRLRAETDRVEACTIAALEKIVQDISGGDAALERRIDAEIREAYDQQTALSARLRLLENNANGQTSALHQLNERVAQAEAAEQARDAEVTERLTRLEASALNTSTTDAVHALRDDVEELARDFAAHRADQGAVQQIEALQARLVQVEAANVEAADRLQGLTRSIGRVSAQSADAVAETQDQLHKLELTLTDMRLEQMSQGAGPQDVIAALQARVAVLEDRQSAALEALRADIAAFVDDNGRRLATLEQLGVASHDFVTEFDELRQRVEGRIHGVEHRSVRALEQVADTVAMIEKRLNSGESREARSA